MAFNVRLYTISKRDNSTKQASGGTLTECILRRGSSAMTPTIEFDFGTGSDGNPTQYNYAYIYQFDRFYFIDDWRFEGALWIATMRVDVLATYKEQIGGTPLYVLRAANAFDGGVPDRLYPCKTGASFERETVATPYTLTGGYYVLGIVNKTPTIGSLCYYACGQQTIKRLCSRLLNDETFTLSGFDADKFSLAIQKAWANPLQYIKSCIYIPTGNQPVTGREEMTCNDWKLGATLTADVFGVEDSHESFTRSFAIPKHPQTEARGNYVNGEPYTRMTLTVPPFGCIGIDTSVTANANTLQATIDIDRPTGLGILTVTCNGIMLNRLEAMIGVPVQLSDVSRDYVGAFTSILGGAVAGVGGAMGAGGPVGAVTMSGASIGNAAEAMAPREQSVGSGGSYAQLLHDWTLDAEFSLLVDDDPTHNGRPYCKMATPASLGGYMLVQDGDVSITGTASEDALLRQYLEGGFYYE